MKVVTKAVAFLILSITLISTPAYACSGGSAPRDEPPAQPAPPLPGEEAQYNAWRAAQGIYDWLELMDIWYPAHLDDLADWLTCMVFNGYPSADIDDAADKIDNFIAVANAQLPLMECKYSDILDAYDAGDYESIVSQQASLQKDANDIQIQIFLAHAQVRILYYNDPCWPGPLGASMPLIIYPPAESIINPPF